MTVDTSVAHWLDRCHFGDCLGTLQQLPDGIAQACVTSPPYFGLRDYGQVGQIGLEATPEEFIARLVLVFREVRRVLRDDGTCWVNMGDTYAGGGNGGGGSFAIDGVRGARIGADKNNALRKGARAAIGDCKPKDLIGIPWMLAFALRAGFSTCSGCGSERRSDLWPAHNGNPVCVDCLLAGRRDSKVVLTERGWYLRQDIVWSKPNPMPESVTDRCTKSHEYLFLLSKSERYYFDQAEIKEPVAAATVARMAQDVEQQQGSARVPGKTNGNMKAVIGGRGRFAAAGRRDGFVRNGKGAPDVPGQTTASHRPDRAEPSEPAQDRNKRSVWTVATKPYKGAHFATYPCELIEPCILAGTSPGSVVLDPFFGSGTTGQVAQQLGRRWIGCDLNPDYKPLQDKRLRQLGMELRAAA